MCPSHVTDVPDLTHTDPVHSIYPPPIQQFTRTVHEYGDSVCARASMSDINTSDEIVFFNELKIVIIIDIERIRANTAEMINFFFMELFV